MCNIHDLNLMSLTGAYGQPGPAAMDPQVQQWFMSVDTDRSGRITAQELQRALINTNWTQFNMETCRLMVGGSICYCLIM